MSNRERRLARLERKPGRKPEVVFIWHDVLKETRDQAIARHFPDGVPEGARIQICSWLEPAAG